MTKFGQAEYSDFMARIFADKLDKILEENGLQKKGATSGQILNAKGQVIGRFCFNCQTF